MERKDNTKTYIIKTIIKNNRLDYYGDYLLYARECGYEICSMNKFYNTCADHSTKHFVLRHDVDYKSKSTEKMFEKELQLGVTSTYYFRWCTIDIPLIKNMLREQFEVGLHFETLSDYAQEFDKRDITAEDIIAARERLKKEINRFKETIGTDIVSVASHGAPMNIEIGLSNNILLENEKYSEYNILFEAYDRELYQYVDEHIMDCNIRYNYGFSYESNPIDAINENKGNIVFLAHPNHWYSSPSRRLIDMAQFARGKCTFETSRRFKRVLREDKNDNELI